MADEKQIQRQWLLLRTISARRHGATVKELAAETGVASRTILRDLELLRRLGFPLQESVSDHSRKHWRLIAKESLVPLQFTWDEAAALNLSQRLLDPLAGTHWWNAARSAFKKIRAAFDERALRYLDKLAGAFHQTLGSRANYAEQAEIIDALMLAIEENRVSLMAYQSPRSTEPVTTEVYPFCLVWHQSALYLVAHSTTHQEVRCYKVDRIHDVDVQQLKFVRPSDFDPTAHLAHSFGIFAASAEPQTIRVRFSADVVHLLEEKSFHPSQTLTKHRDGYVTAEYRLNTFEEFVSWVLSFGGKAEVLEPEDVRERARAELCAALDKYGVDEQTDDILELRGRPKSKSPRRVPGMS